MHARPAPPWPIRLRFFAWVGIVGALLAGMPVWFYLLRGPRILYSDPLLIGGWAVGSAFVLGFWLLLRSTPPGAIRLRERTSYWAILLGALWLQAHALLWLAPGLSDDVLRYRLDGLHWNAGVSPYSEKPGGIAFAGLAARGVDLLDISTPYADVPTIYLPLSQAVFATLRRADQRLPETPWPDGNVREETMFRGLVLMGVPMPRLYVWRCAFAAAAIGTTGVLMAILRRRGRSLWYASLFAWHPMTVTETAGMGHQDPIGILLALAAWWAWDLATYEPESAKPSLTSAVTNGRPILTYAPPDMRDHRHALPAAGVLLALAVGVKPIAGIVAAFWFIARPRRAWLLPFVVTLGAVFSPLLYQRGYAGFLKTLRAYTQTWEANGSLYELIRTQVKPIWTGGFELFIDAPDLGRMVAAVGSAAVAIACVRQRVGWESAYYAICLAGLLLGPIVYPWYLLWPLAVVPLLPRGGLTLLVFAATSGVSYGLWHTPDWKLPAGLSLLEYVPVYVALLIEWRWLAGPPSSGQDVVMKQTTETA